MNNQRKSPINLDSDTFRRHGYWLIDQIAGLMDSLPDKPVTKGEQPHSIKTYLGDSSLPIHGESLDVLLPEITRLLFEHSLFNGHPRFWGYITSSPAPAGMLADLLAASINANVGAYILSPIATEIERQAIRWIGEFIGFAPQCGGLFVSGGNMANITGLLTARRAKAQWDIRHVGFANNQMLIYCSKVTHTWVQKAADLLGFGANNIRWIETNSEQQINGLSLEKQILEDKRAGLIPFIVIANAGTVGTGAIDSIDELAAICRSYNLWLHVDGAYGAPAAALPELHQLYNGIEQADSIALDPHKWLYSPLEAACILVRNERYLEDTFAYKPDYYNFDGNDEDPVVNFHERGFQNSRGFKALKVWLTMKQVGKNGYIAMIREDIALAQTLFKYVMDHAELEAVSHNLSIVTFRFIPFELQDTPKTVEYLNQLNEHILNTIQAGGEAFLSNAVIDGKYCLRVCIVNFRTSLNDIEALIALVVRVGRQEDERLSNTIKV